MLGSQWQDVDLTAGVLQVRRALARHTGEGLVTGPLKTRSARRSVVLPAPLVGMLTAYRRAQATERLRAGELWRTGPGGGWTFASEVGTAIDPRNDLRQWKRLLAAAGIKRRVRIHDLRHTAATMALVSGTDSRVLQGLFGWSSPVLVARYAHVVGELKRQAAVRMGAALWPERGTG